MVERGWDRGWGDMDWIFRWLFYVAPLVSVLGKSEKERSRKGTLDKSAMELGDFGRSIMRILRAGGRGCVQEHGWGRVYTLQDD